MITNNIITVLECPDVEFVDSLINEKAFVKYQKATDVVDIPLYVIHFTPSNMMNDKRFVSESIIIMKRKGSGNRNLVNIFWAKTFEVLKYEWNLSFCQCLN